MIQPSRTPCIDRYLRVLVAALAGTGALASCRDGTGAHPTSPAPSKPAAADAAGQAPVDALGALDAGLPVGNRHLEWNTCAAAGRLLRDGYYQWADIDRCSREGRKTGPSVDGSTRIQVDVDADGKIAVRVAESTLPAPVTSCVLHAIERATRFQEAFLRSCRSRSIDVPVTLPLPPGEGSEIECARYGGDNYQLGVARAELAACYAKTPSKVAGTARIRLDVDAHGKVEARVAESTLPAPVTTCVVGVIGRTAMRDGGESRWCRGRSIDAKVTFPTPPSPMERCLTDCSSVISTCLRACDAGPCAGRCKEAGERCSRGCALSND